MDVPDIKQLTTDLADLMDEFRLDEAKLSGEDWKVSFARQRRTAPPAHVASNPAADAAIEVSDEEPSEPPAPIIHGTPINSPMTGIYYGAPSPSSPPFVKMGESVQAGAVVGLIEAMKVFNEIHSPVSGTVLKIAAESGQLVNPGDPLLIIG